MYTFDHDLFLWLNFDGGVVMDTIMKAISTPAVWAWLYLLILWLVWRKSGWRGALLFLVLAGAAVGLSDMIAGIFKHSGLLKNLWPSFPVRLRPMHTPELEGLIHVVKQGGQYGTVSAHAATMVAMAVMAIAAIGRRWFGWLMLTVVVLVCYSRIYLAYHFPMDIVLGTVVGLIAGAVALMCYRMAMRRITRNY
ncbi:MAG: phosphatase PAP2 family protein [Alistipes sp.]|nr:phosphatase PAP2 family protein [Rikenellaceae bacterium]MBQ3148150.1 phosphatase PAP2 family protein [Alistipes sp.]